MDAVLTEPKNKGFLSLLYHLQYQEGEWLEKFCPNAPYNGDPEAVMKAFGLSESDRELLHGLGESSDKAERVEAMTVMIKKAVEESTSGWANYW